MDLYTSLVRLKQAINGGELPPMTDIPASVTDYIDPKLTIGLGGTVRVYIVTNGG